MSPRSEEYLALAHSRLRGARAAAHAGDASGAVSAAYYAILNAARAALSEQDAAARTHQGVWHLLYERVVATGRLDRALAAAAQRLQEPRERADYGAWLASAEQAEEALGVAGRFVAAIDTLLAG